MKMLVVFLLTFVTSALAGSQCPPRENIYPCSCLSISQGKNIFFTSVTCHRLPSTDAFNSIFGALRQMNIDHFYLYDSFWEAHMLGAEGENKKVSSSHFCDPSFICDGGNLDDRLYQAHGRKV